MALRPSRLIRWLPFAALVCVVVAVFALRFTGQEVTETHTKSSDDDACLGVSFKHCLADVERAKERYPAGQLLAICDDGDGTGSVVPLASEEPGEDACLHAPVPGPLLRVIEVPLPSG